MDSLAFLTLDTWITSDSHWGHDNILRFQGRPADHYARMWQEWVRVVGSSDTVFHLGDLVCFAHRREEPEQSWLQGLTGQKHLILGNHDKHSRGWYERADFTVLGRGNRAFYWHDDRNGALIAFSHEPLDGATTPYTINVHGHIHRNPYWTDVGREQRRNVCVEVTDYRPMRLRDVLDGPNLAATSGEPRQGR